MLGSMERGRPPRERHWRLSERWGGTSIRFEGTPPRAAIAMDRSVVLVRSKLISLLPELAPT